VSVRVPRCPFHAGGHQSAGHPDQADAMMRGGDPPGGSTPSTTTPCGSPGRADGGPTVPGGTLAGGLGLGVMSSGGRIDRVKRPTGDKR
jgi:hypothetical protein